MKNRRILINSVAEKSSTDGSEGALLFGKCKQRSFDIVLLSNGLHEQELNKCSDFDILGSDRQTCRTRKSS